MLLGVHYSYNTTNELPRVVIFLVLNKNSITCGERYITLIHNNTHIANSNTYALFYFHLLTFIFVLYHCVRLIITILYHDTRSFIQGHHLLLKQSPKGCKINYLTISKTQWGHNIMSDLSLILNYTVTPWGTIYQNSDIEEWHLPTAFTRLNPTLLHPYTPYPMFTT